MFVFEQAEQFETRSEKIDWQEGRLMHPTVNIQDLFLGRPQEMTLCLHDRLCVCLCVCLSVSPSTFWYTLLSVYIFLIQQLIRFIFGMHVP